MLHCACNVELIIAHSSANCPLPSSLRANPAPNWMRVLVQLVHPSSFGLAELLGQGSHPAVNLVRPRLQRLELSA